MMTSWSLVGPDRLPSLRLLLLPLLFLSGSVIDGSLIPGLLAIHLKIWMVCSADLARPEEIRDLLVKLGSAFSLDIIMVAPIGHASILSVYRESPDIDVTCAGNQGARMARAPLHRLPFIRILSIVCERWKWDSAGCIGPMSIWIEGMWIAICRSVTWADWEALRVECA